MEKIIIKMWENNKGDKEILLKEYLIKMWENNKGDKEILLKEYSEKTGLLGEDLKNIIKSATSIQLEKLIKKVRIL